MIWSSLLLVSGTTDNDCVFDKFFDFDFEVLVKPYLNTTIVIMIAQTQPKVDIRITDFSSVFTSILAAFFIVAA
jgi:hypothetical protein